ncbi:MAG: hypothetical protein PHW65_05390 [Dehalococcoidales bacterium]|nr:hypothetical protein [Dehalococcoidales bacterium]
MKRESIVHRLVNEFDYTPDELSDETTEGLNHLLSDLEELAKLDL